ncbi:hypothetical protein ACRQ5Q_24420 [Bradyrhizobium sp. PMVTL-01]|uniref:hypothetical protein n=1 Tax=Bradyrhizobium sp. PMVTL-01 TaxID=3434999 RepID=UPI003F716604
MKLDENGRCPVCLKKPLPYRRSGKFFCTGCHRDFSIKTGEWIANWAWKPVCGELFPTYPHSDYVNAKPTAAALRRGRTQQMVGGEAVTRTALSEKMHALADGGHARAAELREKADAFDAATQGFYAQPQTCTVQKFFGHHVRARRLWCDITGEPLI